MSEVEKLSAEKSVVFEIRVAAEKLLPPGKQPSHKAWKETADGSDWQVAFANGYVGVSHDQGDQSHQPWADEWANIYHDHCLYRAGWQTGYKRDRNHVIAVSGFMIDLDSHSPTDTPLAEIEKIVMYEEFAAEVPWTRIVHTGNGVHVHFDLPGPRMLSTDEPERLREIAEMEAKISSVMLYLNDRWKLRPDSQCQDVTRLYRVPGTFNTKAVASFDQADRRKPVRLLKERPPDPERLESFLKGVAEKYPQEIRPGGQYATQPPPVAADGQVALAQAMERPCFKKLWDEGVPQGQRHACRFMVMASLYYEGCQPDDLRALMLDWNQRCHPPDNPDTVQREVDEFLKRPLTIGCRGIFHTCRRCEFQAEADLDKAKAKCPYAQPHSATHSPDRDPAQPFYIGKRGNIIRTELPSESRDEGGEPQPAKHYPVTENGAVIVEEVITRDGIKYYHGRITGGDDWEIPFELPASIWVDKHAFTTAVKALGGDKLLFLNANWEYLAHASEKLCPEKAYRRALPFGWNDDWTSFFGVHSVITVDGIHPPTDELFACNHAKLAHLGLKIPKSADQVRSLLAHIRTDVMELSNPDVMAVMLGTTFIAPLARYLREHAESTNVVTSHAIRGKSGDGKTTMAVLTQSFFGYVTEGDLQTWGSTPLAIQELGFHYRDALYTVDDLKFMRKGQQEQHQIVGVIQGYVDGHGRERLRKADSGDYEPTSGKPILGTLAITGEDFPTGEASVLGRLMIMSMPEATRDKVLLARCLAASHDYSSLMAAFLHWFLCQPDHWEKLLRRFEKLRTFFEKGVSPKATNGPRVACQLALNAAGFSLLLKFMADHGINVRGELRRHLRRLQALCQERLAGIEAEAPTLKMLQMVRDLVGAGKAKITDEKLLSGDGTAVLGYIAKDNELLVRQLREAVAANGGATPPYDPNRGHILMLLPKITLATVQQQFNQMGEKIPFSEASIGRLLKEEGLLVATDPGRTTVRHQCDGKRHEFWAIDCAKVGWFMDAAADGKPITGDGGGTAKA